MAHEEETNQQRSDDDKQWWKDPRIVIPLLGALVGLIYGVTQLWDKLFPPPPPTATVQYIVDVSGGMRGKIGDVQKFAAVKDEIVSEVRGHKHVAASLRLAGPSCTDTYSDPSVDFGRDRGDDFDDALSELQAAGSSDLAHSVTYAVDDLLGQSEDAKLSTLYFFVGGADGCTKQPVEVIDRALRLLRDESNVEISLRFVGVKPPAEVRRLLRAARRRAEKLDFAVDVDYANTPEELGDSLTTPEDPGDVNYGTPGT